MRYCPTLNNNITNNYKTMMEEAPNATDHDDDSKRRASCYSYDLPNQEPNQDGDVSLIPPDILTIADIFNYDDDEDFAALLKVMTNISRKRRDERTAKERKWREMVRELKKSSEERRTRIEERNMRRKADIQRTTMMSMPLEQKSETPPYTDAALLTKAIKSKTPKVIKSKVGTSPLLSSKRVTNFDTNFDRDNPSLSNVISPPPSPKAIKLKQLSSSSAPPLPRNSNNMNGLYNNNFVTDNNNNFVTDNNNDFVTDKIVNFVTDKIVADNNNPSNASEASISPSASPQSIELPSVSYKVLSNQTDNNFKSPPSNALSPSLIDPNANFDRDNPSLLPLLLPASSNAPPLSSYRINNYKKSLNDNKSQPSSTNNNVNVSSLIEVTTIQPLSTEIIKSPLSTTKYSKIVNDKILSTTKYSKIVNDKILSTTKYSKIVNDKISSSSNVVSGSKLVANIKSPSFNIVSGSKPVANTKSPLSNERSPSSELKMESRLLSSKHVTNSDTNFDRDNPSLFKVLSPSPELTNNHQEIVKAPPPSSSPNDNILKRSSSNNTKMQDTKLQPSLNNTVIESSIKSLRSSSCKISSDRTPNIIKSPPSSSERVVNSDANILSHQTANNITPPSSELDTTFDRDNPAVLNALPQSSELKLASYNVLSYRNANNTTSPSSELSLLQSIKPSSVSYHILSDRSPLSSLERVTNPDANVDRDNPSLLPNVFSPSPELELSSLNDHVLSPGINGMYNNNFVTDKINNNFVTDKIVTDKIVTDTRFTSELPSIILPPSLVLNALPPSLELKSVSYKALLHRTASNITLPSPKFPLLQSFKSSSVSYNALPSLQSIRPQSIKPSFNNVTNTTTVLVTTSRTTRKANVVESIPGMIHTGTSTTEYNATDIHVEMPSTRSNISIAHETRVDIYESLIDKYTTTENQSSLNNKPRSKILITHENLTHFHTPQVIKYTEDPSMRPNISISHEGTHSKYAATENHVTKTRSTLSKISLAHEEATVVPKCSSTRSRTSIAHEETCKTSTGKPKVSELRSKILITHEIRGKPHTIKYKINMVLNEGIDTMQATSMEQSSTLIVNNSSFCSQYLQSVLKITNKDTNNNNNNNGAINIIMPLLLHPIRPIHPFIEYLQPEPEPPPLNSYFLLFLFLFIGKTKQKVVLFIFKSLTLIKHNNSETLSYINMKTVLTQHVWSSSSFSAPLTASKFLQIHINHTLLTHTKTNILLFIPEFRFCKCGEV
ncbi:chitinase-like protein [Fragilariopsis cylindrus CCMP1102]|uniref:Chitinase-like protein n=1 Tax=Fragilariopsis cylindrus CCMP1102 TaxID=635003 RepID=A0A1E7F1R5_9STRA|nr:chitinase-like protein [Fragilariopsis cylindrus CCMP1102]|eukprot:OEU12140.1 chitinase-like protein [Fragilariopsis cylindrus CCMP1102]